MRHGIALLFTLALGGAAACAGEHHHAERGEHHEVQGPTGDFHAVLAPVWHSDKGPARDAKACDQAKTMAERAAAVEGANGSDAYKAAARALSAAVAALSTACAAPARTDVDAKLSAVHDAFHHVAEQGGGHHEHH
jgi:hypothetical protein